MPNQDVQSEIRQQVESAGNESALNQALPDKWMKDWTEGMCEFMGKCPGGQECLDCRKRRAISALSAPVSASAPVKARMGSIMGSVKRALDSASSR